MSNPNYTKEQILKNLVFHIDEPDTISDLFGSKNLSEKLEKFLLDTDDSTQIPTPYNIAIHGEWGSGKTSFIYRTYKNIDKKLNEKSEIRCIWFDAWQYEQLDVVSALLQNIGKEYNNLGSDFTKVAGGVALTFLDIGLKVFAKSSINEIKELYTNYIDSSVEDIKSFKQKLEDIIGEKGRLIVFIDDLDRCDIENVLGMLSAIKLLLSARGVIFVIAVDIEKLEKAWQLRYNHTDIIDEEAKSYIDKIFQLRISLPIKESEEIMKYIDNLASALPPKIKDLIIHGCPPNPRKIKKLLNLIYFCLKTTDLNESDFETEFHILVVWIICINIYPEIAKIFKVDPEVFSSIVILLRFIKDFETMHKLIEHFLHPKEGHHITFQENCILPHNRIFNPNSKQSIPEQVLIGPSAIKALKSIDNNPYAFNFFKHMLLLYPFPEIIGKPSDISEIFTTNKEGKEYYKLLTENLESIILRTDILI